MALLELEGVSKTFAATHGLMSGGSRHGADELETRIAALREISLQIDQGESLGVIGESGAGKTTLAELVAGLTLPDDGSIKLDGLTAGPSVDRQQWSRRVQLVWQDAAGSLDPRMKLGRAVSEPLRIQGAQSDDVGDKLRQLFEEVDLGFELADRYPHELSGGQVQRAVIARALAMNPGLLVLDEPASALDARVKRRIVDLLIGLRKERGMAFMVIAHDLRLASELTKKLVILQAGEIVESGETLHLLSAPEHSFTRELIQAVPRLPQVS